jgi:hypothetical protein
MGDGGHRSWSAAAVDGDAAVAVGGTERLGPAGRAEDQPQQAVVAVVTDQAVGRHGAAEPDERAAAGAGDDRPDPAVDRLPV